MIPEIEYKKILENMPICCVDLVIHHRGKVLLVYRTNEPAKNQWWLPGGRLFKNEKLEDAAVRKAFEETGLKVEIEKNIGAYEAMFQEGPFPDVKNGVHSVAVCFLMKVIEDNPDIIVDKTSSDFRWIDKIEENLNPYVKDIIRDSKIF